MIPVSLFFHFVCIGSGGAKNNRDPRNIPTNNESLVDLYDSSLRQSINLTSQSKAWEDTFDHEYNKLKKDRAMKAKQKQLDYLSKSKTSSFNLEVKNDINKPMSLRRMTKYPEYLAPIKNLSSIKSTTSNIPSMKQNNTKSPQ